MDRFRENQRFDYWFMRELEEPVWGDYPLSGSNCGGESDCRPPLSEQLSSRWSSSSPSSARKMSRVLSLYISRCWERASQVSWACETSFRGLKLPRFGLTKEKKKLPRFGEGNALLCRHNEVSERLWLRTLASTEWTV